MYMMIVGWVGAGFRDCLFQAIIVGEPAPTGCMKEMGKNPVSLD